MNDTPTPRTDDSRRRFQQMYDAGKLDIAIENTLLDMGLFERELSAVTEQRDRLAEALDYSTGVITALGEIEPDIYDLSIDARNKRTGEKYKLSIIDVIEMATKALQSLNPKNETR